MLKNTTRTLIITILLAGLLVTGVGCTEWLLASYAGSFGAGYATGAAVAGASATTTCYRNGEPVECSSLPAGIAP